MVLTCGIHSTNRHYYFHRQLGALVSSGPLAVLVSKVGWRNSFYAVGVITAIISVAAFFLIKDKPSLVGFEDLKERHSLLGKRPWKA